VSFRVVAGGVALLAAFACGERTAVADKSASTPPARNDSASAHQFAQEFYEWYTPIANGPHNHPAYWEVLRQRPEVLDSALLTALRADSGANDQSVATRESFNADPFLMSQDPCPSYDVGSVRADSSGYRIAITPKCADMTYVNGGPTVRVKFNNGRWQIVDLVYEKGTLRSWLCTYAKADLNPKRRSVGC